TRPALTSPCRKSRNAESLLGAMVYAPHFPPVDLSQTRWNTYCTQSVACGSASAFWTYSSSVDSLVAFLGLGGVRLAYASPGVTVSPKGPAGFFEMPDTV